jgi:hypothetical protein
MSPSDVKTLIETYVAAWSEPDAAARGVLLDACWHADGTYTDPLSHVSGRDELDARIAGHLARIPGSRITLKGEPDHHHRHIRFDWLLRRADGTEMRGMDYGELSPDHKLSKIVGFF